MARLTDVLYPADNRLTEEAFKKYIYEKPGPAYPECPYRVVYPHRTRRFSLNQQAKANLRRTLTGMERVSRLVGRSRPGSSGDGCARWLLRDVPLRINRSPGETNHASNEKDQPLPKNMVELGDVRVAYTDREKAGPSCSSTESPRPAICGGT